MPITRLSVVLAVALAVTALAQDAGQRPPIVLDIPISKAPAARESTAGVTIVVRGMSKSRSGAT